MNGLCPTPNQDRPDDRVFTTKGCYEAGDGGGATYTLPQDALSQAFEEADHSFEDNSPLLGQVGGCHYAVLAIQPMTYALENNLNYAQANVVKYVTRYKQKNGIEDLRKAIHCLELLIEHEEKQL